MMRTANPRLHFSSVPNAGSFIRPTANGVDYGTSFLKALVTKYIELPHGTSVEKVILGSSNGAIEVEAPGLDKVRGKLSNLQRLREVSLDNHGVATSDPPGEIKQACPGKSADGRLTMAFVGPMVANGIEEISCLRRPGLLVRKPVSGNRVTFLVFLFNFCRIVADKSDP